MSLLVAVKTFFAISFALLRWVTGSTIRTPTRLPGLGPAVTPMASTASALMFRLTAISLMYGIQLFYSFH